MSRMFGDIYEAIRYVRVTKGTTETKILEYVEDRAGGNLPTGKASSKHYQLITPSSSSLSSSSSSSKSSSSSSSSYARTKLNKNTADNLNLFSIP